MKRIYSTIIFLLFFTSNSTSLFGQALEISPSEDSAAAEETIVDSAALVVISSIQITGYEKTKDYIIAREIPFKEGEFIQRLKLPGQLELCRQQLMNTALFVDVEVNSSLTGDKVFVFINVKERWYLFPLPYFKIIGRNFNEWWVENNRSLQRINYGFKFMQENVSGRNDKLNLWLITGYSQEAILRYENPFVDKTLKNGVGLYLAYSRNREVNFDVDYNKQKFIKNPDKFLIKSYTVGLSYSYRPAVKTRHNFNLSYIDVTVDSVVTLANPRFYPNGSNRVHFPEFTYGLQHYNVDYIPYPLKGYTGELYFTTRMSNDFTTQLTVRGSYNKEIFPKSYIQFQAAGLIKLPFDQYYYASGMMGGSDFYMRGLEYYVIQGVAGGIGRATAIKQALAFTFHNPIHIKGHDKIPFKFMVKAYGDLGYAYLKNPGTSMLNNQLLRTYGAGIDVISIYDFVLKLEYSINQLGQQGFFIHTKSDF